MGKSKSITYSAPGKIHLLGEHAVVYGKPALVASINLRAYTTITPAPAKVVFKDKFFEKIRKIIEPIVKKQFQLTTVPPYLLDISTDIPIGAGLGSSAAISASYIASFLTFLKIKWDLNLINELTFKAEKVFHGNPSGADNTVVVFGGLIWFRKETEKLKTIQKLPFLISPKISKSFVLINTGTPKESTKEMVLKTLSLYQKKPGIVEKFLQKQEQLTKELVEALEQKNTKKVLSTLKMGENNLETIEVVSKQVLPIIREVESDFGAAKICGAGGKKGPTGILLCMHSNPKILIEIANKYKLEYFKTNFGTEGLKKE